MQTILEQLIVDFHERPLPDLTPRALTLPRLAGKVDAVIGMRRTGKTYLLYQVMGELLAKGVPKHALLYINFEDERLFPMAAGDLHQVTDAYYRLYPQGKDGICHLFFDEIQNVPGWERFVRRLVDTEQVRIAVTGSSSRLLSREIATSLRGRSLSTEVFPFSFSESLRHQGVDSEFKRRPGAKHRAILENRLRNYLFDGGFPEVQGLETELRVRILQEYVDVVILRDVVERHQVSNILALRALLRHLLGSPASLFSINKFYQDLRSQGIACSKNSLHEYLEYLADAYLVYAVEIHSPSVRSKRVNPRKLYVVDTGLARAFAHRPRVDVGHLLENLVFLALRRTGRQIEYYRTGKGHEVDFLVGDLHGSRELIQVAALVDQPKTLERELRALREAMEETGIVTATLVTLEEERRIETDSGPVEIVPAWRWLLIPSSHRGAA